MVKIICIEGQKGAGKSTLIALLEKKTQNIVIAAPFRDVVAKFPSEYIGCETTYTLSQNEQGSTIVTNIVTSYIDEVIKSNLNKDLIIFDRGWITGICTVMGANASDEEKEKQLKIWDKYKFPTIFMDTGINTVIARREGMLNEASGLSSYKKLEDDMEVRRNIAEDNKSNILLSFFTELLDESEIENDVYLKVKEIKQIIKEVL